MHCFCRIYLDIYDLPVSTHWLIYYLWISRLITSFVLQIYPPKSMYMPFYLSDKRGFYISCICLSLLRFTFLHLVSYINLNISFYTYILNCKYLYLHTDTIIYFKHLVHQLLSTPPQHGYKHRCTCISPYLYLFLHQYSICRLL